MLRTIFTSFGAALAAKRANIAILAVCIGLIWGQATNEQKLRALEILCGKSKTKGRKRAE